MSPIKGFFGNLPAFTKFRQNGVDIQSPSFFPWP